MSCLLIRPKVLLAMNIKMHILGQYYFSPSMFTFCHRLNALTMVYQYELSDDHLICWKMKVNSSQRGNISYYGANVFPITIGGNKLVEEIIRKQQKQVRRREI